MRCRSASAAVSASIRKRGVGVSGLGIAMYCAAPASGGLVDGRRRRVSVSFVLALVFPPTDWSLPARGFPRTNGLAAVASGAVAERPDWQKAIP